ncbi:hypothetical protein M0R89_15330 [Halorussus limi]|uniref:DUF7344 domain-containing protein n=2 Tax=Halorussus TaxID=1070314 RepID=A0A8U0IGW3_9EURY|nr:MULTISPECIES: hypothetical protein [Halorussus]UPV73902.1 hypothetical protein M0R89_15330 [Halorussus limi]UPV99920.1 hypothetical protein M0R88_15550 [Halorussus gelatinilyticus]
MDELEEFLDLVESDTVSVNTLFDVLRAERRRYVLSTLQSHETSMSLTDLAHEVAKRENGEASPTTEAVTRVHASLYHVHIPKLKEANIIEYDQERRIVQHKL